MAIYFYKKYASTAAVGGGVDTPEFIALKTSGAFSGVKFDYVLIAEADAKHFSSVLRTALELPGPTVALMDPDSEKELECREIDLTQLGRVHTSDFIIGLDVLHNKQCMSLNNAEACYKVAGALGIDHLINRCNDLAVDELIKFKKGRVSAAPANSLYWNALDLIPYLVRYGPEHFNRVFPL